MSKVKFFLLLAVFFGPFFFAWYLYSSGWRPEPNHHGEFINPPLQIADVGFEQDDGKWIVLFVHGDPCVNECQHMMESLPKFRVSFGKDMERIALIETQNNHYLDNNTIYIVDPLGNIFLRYSVKTELKDIYKDLRRLLKVSMIG